MRAHATPCMRIRACNRPASACSQHTLHNQTPQASGAATTFCVGLLFGTETYTHKSALKVFIVGLGVVIASYGDVRANLLGVMLQVGCIVCDAVRCTLLQLVMQHSDVKLTPVGTLYHVAPMAAAILCLPAAVSEFGRLVHHTSPIPWLWLFLSCAAASSLNVVVFTLIGKTSALTTSVTGPLKEWVCILTAMIIYKTPVTGQQWLGYAIALVGIFWYQRDKFFSQQQPVLPVTNGGGKEDEKEALLQFQELLQQQQEGGKQRLSGS
jgi:drug/metabolite transporter (DMT)-like permease